MTLTEKAQSLRQSEITRLAYQGETVGLRAKYFNLHTDVFEYYDFNIKYIKDSAIRKFLSSRSFATEELVEHDGLLMTPDEISGVKTVMEFKDEESAVRVLTPIIKVYEGYKE